MINLSPNVNEKIGTNFHNLQGHPICEVKNKIYKHFPKFDIFDNISPRIQKEDNVDHLFVSEGYNLSCDVNSYHLDDKRMLRTWMSIYRNDFLKRGIFKFLLSGEVFRRDVLDKFHYPVFYQLFGTCICDNPETHIHAIICELLSTITPNREYKSKTTIHGYEYSTKIGGEFIKILNCGLINDEVVRRTGIDGETGWYLTVGLDRLAMVAFDISDINMLWNWHNSAIWPEKNVFYRDLEFVLPDGFRYNIFCEIIREASKNLISDIKVLLSAHLGIKSLKKFRFTYRGITQELTSGEVEYLHQRIINTIEKEVKGEFV